LIKQRRNVLVVEDDTQLAHLYSAALALRGISVTRAVDGVAALRSVDESQPDLVLLDLLLPNVDGWTVLRELALNPKTNQIPVIVVTGIEPPPHLPHARVVVRKPCDASLVAKIVEDYFIAGPQLS
jgi:CheY-like chemotaxis protein